MRFRLPPYRILHLKTALIGILAALLIFLSFALYGWLIDQVESRKPYDAVIVSALGHAVGEDKPPSLQQQLELLGELIKDTQRTTRILISAAPGSFLISNEEQVSTKIVPDDIVQSALDAWYLGAAKLVDSSGYTWVEQGISWNMVVRPLTMDGLKFYTVLITNLDRSVAQTWNDSRLSFIGICVVIGGLVTASGVMVASQANSISTGITNDLILKPKWWWAFEFRLIAKRFNAAIKKNNALTEDIKRVNHIAAHDIKGYLTALVKSNETIDEIVKELSEYLPVDADEVILDAIDSIKLFSGRNITMANNAYDVLHQRNKLYDLDKNIEVKPCFVTLLLEPLLAAFSAEGQFKIVNNCPADQTVMVDHSLFVSLLANLVRNGFIHNTSSIKTVIVSARMEKGDCIICVTDNGIGIPAEYLESWGKQMGQAARLDTKKDGSGMGLYSVRTIVDAHKNSSIKIDSTLGQGSAFIIRIGKKKVSFV